MWEEIGRKFTNLSYDEADRLSRKNKEFINALFPEGDIYTCMLSASARETIGEVNEMTVPVKKMLENIGFKYTDNIDPFDGGPHYQATTDQVKPVKLTSLVQYRPDPKGESGEAKSGLLMHLAPTGLRAMQVKARIKGKSLVGLGQDYVDHLEVKEDSELYFLEM
jgi:arginine N-succinyltransferase